MAANRPTSGRVLVGCSEANLARKVRTTLEAVGLDVTICTAAATVLSSFECVDFDLVLLAFGDMEEDGFALVRDLRSRSKDDHVVILVASGERGESSIAAAFDAGVDDFLRRPLDWSLLRHRMGALLFANRRLARLSETCASLKEAQVMGRIGSWELDLDSFGMLWSEETFRLLGLVPGAEEADFAIFSMFVHPQDDAAVMQHFSEALEVDEAFELTYRVQLANGRSRHVQVRGERPPGPTRRVRGTIQDVSDQQEIRRLADYDSLTGLSNRRRFKEQLERSVARAKASGRPMALLYMDLDQFKRINDTLGHTAGDCLLKHIAGVLFDKVRTTDIVGRAEQAGAVEISRLGGDEFSVVLSEIASPEDAGLVAQRILDAVTTPISLEGQQISVTVSIGIALCPGDGEDAETLVKHADTAMYKAKERGRNVYEFFSAEMNRGVLRKLTLEQHLRHALERNELRVVYQPRVSFRRLEIAGFEALLRWDSELGSVSPKEFIPVAEDTGLIVPIGEWVLETACAQAKRWHAAGFEDARVSVNVSSRQFVHNDMLETVARILTNTGLAPRHLELEITESLLLEEDPKTETTLREIKAMGVAVALDDFGTGYSSVSYLTRLPLDMLKLDLSLVRDLGSSPSARGIATAMIAMAHAVDLEVTAEGVDEIEQARFLRDEGCDELQGFLLSAAVSAEESEQLLASPDSCLQVLYDEEGDPSSEGELPTEGDVAERDAPVLKRRLTS